MRDTTVAPPLSPIRNLILLPDISERRPDGTTASGTILEFAILLSDVRQCNQPGKMMSRSKMPEPGGRMFFADLVFCLSCLPSSLLLMSRKSGGVLNGVGVGRPSETQTSTCSMLREGWDSRRGYVGWGDIGWSCFSLLSCPFSCVFLRIAPFRAQPGSPG